MIKPGKILVLLYLLLILGCSQNSQEEGYPNRPIKVIVPFKSGGESDTFARIMKKGIEDNNLLPVPMVIINRDGTSATRGSRSVKDADPDGYTILLLHDALLTAKYNKVVDYGPEAFEPVAATGKVGLLVVVREDSPYADLKDLMAAAEENPDAILFGVNLGAPSHFAGLMLEKSSSGSLFRYTQIGSGADRFQKLKGGHIQVTVFSIGEFVRYESAGFRALAYFGKERHPQFPNVATTWEQGFRVTSSNMQMWWFPKGTSKKRIDYMAGVLEKALGTNYVRGQMAQVHCDPVYLKGKKLRQTIREREEGLRRITLRSFENLPNFPMIIGAFTLGLLILVLYKQSSMPPKKAKGWNLNPNQIQAAICLGLTTIYIAALNFTTFWLATSVYVLSIGAVLAKLQPRKMVVIGILAVAISFGLQYVFTQVLVVDLP